MSYQHAIDLVDRIESLESMPTNQTIELCAQLKAVLAQMRAAEQVRYRLLLQEVKDDMLHREAYYAQVLETLRSAEEKAVLTGSHGFLNKPVGEMDATSDRSHGH